MKQKKQQKAKSPEPVRREQRICFGISWFETEDDAIEYHNEVRASGRTYNGGFYDGMPCGRASQFDYVPKDGTHKGRKLYAVTD